MLKLGYKVCCFFKAVGGRACARELHTRKHVLLRIRSLQLVQRAFATKMMCWTLARGILVMSKSLTGAINNFFIAYPQKYENCSTLGVGRRRTVVCLSRERSCCSSSLAGQIVLLARRRTFSVSPMKQNKTENSFIN
jgi:hypothetical protein